MATTEATHDDETEPKTPRFSGTSVCGTLEHHHYSWEQPTNHVRIFDDGDMRLAFAIGAMEQSGWEVMTVDWDEEYVQFGYNG